MNPTAHLSREDRIQRIGEILAKGVTLLYLHENRLTDPSCIKPTIKLVPQHKTPNPDFRCMELDSEARAIVEYLQYAGSASPNDIRRHFHLSRTSLWRKLKDLHKLGIISKDGCTRSVRYKLDPSYIARSRIEADSPMVIARPSR